MSSNPPDHPQPKEFDQEQSSEGSVNLPQEHLLHGNQPVEPSETISLKSIFEFMQQTAILSDRNFEKSNEKIEAMQEAIKGMKKNLQENNRAMEGMQEQSKAYRRISIVFLQILLHTFDCFLHAFDCSIVFLLEGMHKNLKDNNGAIKELKKENGSVLQRIDQTFQQLSFSIQTINLQMKACLQERLELLNVEQLARQLEHALRELNYCKKYFPQTDRDFRQEVAQTSGTANRVANEMNQINSRVKDVQVKMQEIKDSIEMCLNHIDNVKKQVEAAEKDITEVKGDNSYLAGKVIQLEKLKERMNKMMTGVAALEEDKPVDFKEETEELQKPEPKRQVRSEDD